MRIRGLVLALLSIPASLAAQAQPASPAADTVQEAGSAAPSPVPGPLEISSRYRTLADSAALAERGIAQLADVDALAADFESAQQRQTELQQLLGTVSDAEYTRPERISRVRDQALLQDQRLNALRDRTSTRLEELGQVRARWMQRRQVWQRWQQALREDPDYALAEPELRQALARIDSVLQRIADVVPAILSLQREIESLRLQNGEILERTAAIRAGRREALLRQNQPVLFSSAFWSQMRGVAALEWPPPTLAQPGAHRAFLRSNWQLLLLHLAFGLALALIARRIRRIASPEGAWSGMLLHPWAVGIFASTAFMTQWYSLAPPLWDVVMWSLLAGSGAVLTTRLFARRALRLMVYFFGGLYPLFLLAEAIRLPAPLFRLGVAIASAAGLVIFALFARRSTRFREGGPGVKVALILGAALLAVVLTAEILGFYLLARWIMHATVTSALVLFLVGFLVVVARGAIQTLLRVEAKGRLKFLRRIGIPLAERLIVLLQVILIIGASLAVLDIWELAGSPVETWNRITGVGVTVAGVQITLGRVLLALVMIYIAMVASWLLRTFVGSELSPRWELDRGVGDSISTLVHYLLITISVLIALGVLGVELQNFAIIAGALGVGIGFGLQNVVNNFVSGLILLFERPVRVGDIVVIGGEWGTVSKIGLRSTVVVTFDRAELIVPNGDLVSEKVTNWTLSNPIARLVVPIGVAYGTDVDRVLQLLRQASGKHHEILPDPEPQVLFVGFGESALDFELRVWVRELSLRLEVRSAVLAEVDRLFRSEGIEIPFPQRDLHVRSIDPRALDSVLRTPPEQTEDSTAAPAAQAPPAGEQHGDGRGSAEGAPTARTENSADSRRGG